MNDLREDHASFPHAIKSFRTSDSKTLLLNSKLLNRPHLAAAFKSIIESPMAIPGVGLLSLMKTP
jgi:hypothetical protein